mmetsp:Transcript_6171/g.9145  ORF Transcript_6171/g.9145 Transcript_6171/m.9145 type:complete len:362 (-) Transcript_6171:55-1140(-)
MAAGSEVDTEQARKNARAGAMKASKKKAPSNMNTYIAVGIFAGIVGVVIGILVLYPELPLHKVPALNSDLMEAENSLGLSFTQKSNDFFENWMLSDVQKSAQNSVSQQARNLSPCSSYINEGELVPENYDSREHWPHCIEPVAKQGNCSSAYALASAGVLSERFCIQSKGSIIVNLSAQDIISCDRNNRGCEGGYADTVWKYISDVGLVESECFPYSSQNHEVPDCSEKCKTQETYKVTDYCATATEQGIMREIKNNGPVMGLMNLFTDFLGYSQGIYKPQLSADKLQATQAVEIIGWGTDSSTKDQYWIIKNSWGTGWGENGYARVARGVKELGLEDFALAGSPWITKEMSSGSKVEVEN